MNWEYSLARRLYAQADNQRRVSRLATYIATSGVAIGIAVMVISISMVLGFKTSIQEKVLGFGAHIQIFNATGINQPVSITDDLMDELCQQPNIRHAQRFVVKNGVFKTDESFCGVVFRGIDAEHDTTFLHQHLTEGIIPNYADSASLMQIVISKKMADKMLLKTGDRVYAYFFDNHIKARRMTVTGIYNTYLSDFDEVLVYAHQQTLRNLSEYYPDQYSGVELLLKDFNLLNETEEHISEMIRQREDAYGARYISPTVKDMYPQIFSWLSLLDTNVVVILILMLCVAGFTMISGLLIIILERTNFIGVMKAMGATNKSLQKIFLHYASFIILRGLCWGNVLALACIVLQQQFQLVPLDPETYYVATVPLETNWFYLLLLNIATMILCLTALILPSLIVSHIHPSRSIRFE